MFVLDPFYLGSSGGGLVERGGSLALASLVAIHAYPKPKTNDDADNGIYKVVRWYNSVNRLLVPNLGIVDYSKMWVEYSDA